MFKHIITLGALNYNAFHLTYSYIYRVIVLDVLIVVADIAFPSGKAKSKLRSFLCCIALLSITNVFLGSVGGFVSVLPAAAGAVPAVPAPFPVAAAVCPIGACLSGRRPNHQGSLLTLALPVWSR